MRKLLLSVLSIVVLVILVISFITYQTQSGDGYLGILFVYPLIFVLIGVFRLILLKKHTVFSLYRYQEFIFIPLLVLPIFIDGNVAHQKVNGQIATLIGFITCFCLAAIVLFIDIPKKNLV